jgi:ankyrin repeat protein
MSMGISRYDSRVSQSTTATDEKPQTLVPGPQATHAERQAFINEILPPDRRCFMLSLLNEKALARFVAYFRIKDIDPQNADEVARFIHGYEQYCGKGGQAILNENTELFGELVSGAWEFFNLPDRDGYTPLMRAVEENDEQLVRDLILSGAEVNDRVLVPLKDATSLLALVAESGDLQCLERVLASCRALQTPVDWGGALEIAAKRGDWKMLARMLDYLKDVHRKTPIPVPIRALKAAVKCFEPGLRDRPAEVLQCMFREAIVNPVTKFPEKKKIFQLLVDLARNDRALAAGILKPMVRVGFTIRQTIGYDLPELIGLLVEAGADIGERNNNGNDLLEIAIASYLSLETIEAVLKAFAVAEVDWRDNVCLQYAMQQDSVPLASLLRRYGARWRGAAVETWFSEHPD